jgi:hypothetical protein
MRSFTDKQGHLWDVAIGKESYGTFLLIFSQRDGREIRKTQLSCSTQLDATDELANLTIDDLCTSLATSESWQ